MKRLAALLIALAAALTFSNTFGNSFQLDDGSGLVRNPWIRSLANIPRFFVDPQTLTSNKANADYRPVLQITYALNHAISGYDTWSWHAVNLALHVCVSLALLALVRELLTEPVAASAALLFAVHPIATGNVNYIWARSSLLVAALVVPATVLYLRGLAENGAPEDLVAPFALFVLALFTKAEAVSLFGVLAVAELTLAPDRPPTLDPRQLLRPATRARLLPFAAVLVAYLALRQVVLPDWVEPSRHAAEVTRWYYFLTQLRVVWLYVLQLVAPFFLAPDDTSYRVSTSLADPAVLAALAGWILVGCLIYRNTARAPIETFLALTFLVHLSPHSSVAPLAEMYNEHRPYLAYTGLLPLLVLWLHRLAAKLGPSPRPAIALTATLALALAAVSHERNTIWKDELSFWTEVVRMAPDSVRANVNLGALLARRGQLAEGERLLRRAARLGPTNPHAHINLANVLAQRDDRPGVLAACTEAIRVAPDAALPYYARAMFLASWGEDVRAVRDLEDALRRDERHLDSLELLVQCSTRLGQHARARAAAEAGLELDPERFRPYLSTR